MNTVILTDLIPSKHKPEWFLNLNTAFQRWNCDHDNTLYDVPYAQRFMCFLTANDVPLSIVPMPSADNELSIMAPHLVMMPSGADAVMFHLRWGG